jgi:hypothetical protein
MPHPLAEEYGLTPDELLDAINRRFRAKVTLEGAVAEVHLGKHIKNAQERGLITRYEEHDRDNYPDYTIWVPGGPGRGYLIECKNIRDAQEAYRKAGIITAYKVETQKTRASKEDPSSRFYDTNHFDVLAVCLGKKTHDWRQFFYICTLDLPRHSKHQTKIAVMHPVPLSTGPVDPPWFTSLDNLIGHLTNA